MRVEQCADARFVVAVDDRPDQAHRHRLDVLGPQPGDDVDDRRLIERLGDRTVGPDAFRNFVAEGTRNIGVGIDVSVVERLATPAAFADQQDVAVTLCREEGGARRRRLDVGIGGARCAMHEGAAAAEQSAGVVAEFRGGECDHVEQAADRIVRRGRSLEEPKTLRQARR